MPRTRTTSNKPASLLKQLDRSIASAERDLSLLDKERESIERQLTVLRSARADLANAVLDGATKPSKSYGSRVDALISIFNEHDQPVTVDEIMTELAAQGRPDERRLVHSTISYLKRHGKVTQTDRGMYAAAA